MENKVEYMYCIEDGQFSYNFSYPDKKCHHKIGDTFIAENDEEVKVADIDHENGIVFCLGYCS